MKELLDGICEKGIAGDRQKEFVNIATLDPENDDRILIEAAKLIPKQSRDYGASSIRPRMNAPCASSFEHDGWPCLRASVSPVWRQRRYQRPAVKSRSRSAVPPPLSKPPLKPYDFVSNDALAVVRRSHAFGHLCQCPIAYKRRSPSPLTATCTTVTRSITYETNQLFRVNEISRAVTATKTKYPRAIHFKITVPNRYMGDFRLKKVWEIS